MRKVGKLIIISTFLHILAGCTTHQQIISFGATIERPSIEVVSALEMKIEMPVGAGLLTEYTRYYAFDEDQNAKIIIGLFSRSPTPKIRIVGYQAMPHITDGGCGIVHVRYDVAAQKILSILCGGIA